MKNRAKCKKCLSIIESFLPDEMIYCKCGAIAVCDGTAMRMWPLNSPDFLRIDDVGNEIKVRYEDKGAEGSNDKSDENGYKNPSKTELIQALEDSLTYTENTPDHEKHSFVTHVALCYYLRAVINILKRE